MRIHLQRDGRRHRWLAVACLAAAAVVALGVTAMAGLGQAGPAQAPPITLVGETKTGTATPTGGPQPSDPPPSGPQPTGGPGPSAPPSIPPDDDVPGSCGGIALIHRGEIHAVGWCDPLGNGVAVGHTLPGGPYGSVEEAKRAADDWASHMNRGAPVMDGPGCKWPIILC